MQAVFHTKLVRILILLSACAAQVLASPQPGVVHTLDVRTLRSLDVGARSNAVAIWDAMHCLGALQGLANRDEPRLYIFCAQEFGVETDSFWLDWLRKEDGWLRNTQVRRLNSLHEAIREFRSSFRGLVVYDRKVRATSNLASTAAGCEDLLPVAYDPDPGSLYHYLTASLGLPVKLWLVETNGHSKFSGHGKIPDVGIDSTGSTKADAYLWAIHRWLKSRKAAPRIAAYYIDQYWTDHPIGGAALHTLSNHDYFIARKAFFFDLSPWGDEAPGDDPGQPIGTDHSVFLKVMRAIYDLDPTGVIKVGGFVPWPHKYTSASKPAGRHEPVPTEWEFGRLISQFNGYMEADAAGLSDMANASFFQHYPLKDHYPQPNRKPGLADWKRAGLVDASGRLSPRLFVGHYVGDYDSAAWLYKAVPKMFPHAGSVPLGWAFDPNLADRAPQAMAYARANAGSNDWFIAGDSGAGYLNARALTVRPDSNLPPGLRAWTRHCERCYKQWDLSITGFLLDGSAGASTETEYSAYRRFSPDGIGTHFERGPAMKVGVPTCPELDLPGDPREAAAVISSRAVKGEAAFLWCRSILKKPSWYEQVSEALSKEHPDVAISVVDPYTFFGLVKLSSQQK